MAIRWLAGWIFALGALGAAGWLIVGSLQQRLDAEASSGWPSVAGVIESATIESTREATQRRPTRYVTRYRPQIVYVYVVEGKRYEGTRISFNPPSPRDRFDAERVLGEYRPGSEVLVSYDPDAPENAVLERGLPWGQTLAPLAGGVVLIGAGALFGFLAHRSPSRPAFVGMSRRG